MQASRCTLARIDAAAMAWQRASPLISARCGKASSSGTASTSRKSGAGCRRLTAIRMAMREAW